MVLAPRVLGTNNSDNNSDLIQNYHIPKQQLQQSNLQSVVCNVEHLKRLLGHALFMGSIPSGGMTPISK